MFSRTALGRFVRRALRGLVEGCTPAEQPLLFVSLLLADAELFQDDTTLPRLVDCLSVQYGAHGTARFAEAVDARIASKIVTVLSELEPAELILVQPYLSGILNKDLPGITKRKARSIYLRQRRIFHCDHHQFKVRESAVTPVGLVGLKGAGKTYIMDELKRRGEAVHEIYRWLDQVRAHQPTSLPLKPSDWEDEPLMLGLQYRGWQEQPPRRFFVGSLLRLSEMSYLAAFGKPEIVYVEAPNAIRHDRARRRGRVIEQHATESQLIQLDAHRGGEWPGYETNDVGSLIALSRLTIPNDGTLNASEIVDRICEHLDTRGG